MATSVDGDCSESADVVICGAGMAGLATAYHLRRRGVRDLLLIDEREPLTLTSDKGTEAYRNWWPRAEMVAFMNRSIDLLEEIGPAAGLTRPGYAFLTADETRIEGLRVEAERIAALGAGALRVDRYERDGPVDGADLVTDPAVIRAHFPFLAPDVRAMLHVRRCGFVDARALGAWLLRESGARVRRDRVVGPGRLASGATFGAGRFVVAAGPLLKETAGSLGCPLPSVFCELHAKGRFRDPRGVVPRDAPMLVWLDPIGTRPGGFHCRPRGADGLLAIWTYDAGPREPVVPPPPFDPAYGVALREGLERLVPGLDAVPGPVDGGYYCKTADNLPLIGPLPAADTYVVGALSGYGIMGSQAAGELAALHVTGGDLPPYARAFDPGRTPRTDGREGQL